MYSLIIEGLKTAAIVADAITITGFIDQMAGSKPAKKEDGLREYWAKDHKIKNLVGLPNELYAWFKGEVFKKGLEIPALNLLTSADLIEKSGLRDAQEILEGLTRWGQGAHALDVLPQQVLAYETLLGNVGKDPKKMGDLPETADRADLISAITQGWKTTPDDILKIVSRDGLSVLRKGMEEQIIYGFLPAVNDYHGRNIEESGRVLSDFGDILYGGEKNSAGIKDALKELNQSAVHLKESMQGDLEEQKAVFLGLLQEFKRYSSKDFDTKFGSLLNEKDFALFKELKQLSGIIINDIQTATDHTKWEGNSEYLTTIAKNDPFWKNLMEIHRSYVDQALAYESMIEKRSQYLIFNSADNNLNSMSKIENYVDNTFKEYQQLRFMIRQIVPSILSTINPDEYMKYFDKDNYPPTLENRYNFVIDRIIDLLEEQNLSPHFKNVLALWGDIRVGKINLMEGLPKRTEGLNETASELEGTSKQGDQRSFNSRKIEGTKVDKAAALMPVDTTVMPQITRKDIIKREPPSLQADENTSDVTINIKNASEDLKNLLSDLKTFPIEVSEVTDTMALGFQNVVGKARGIADELERANNEAVRLLQSIQQAENEAKNTANLLDNLKPSPAASKVSDNPRTERRSNYSGDFLGVLFNNRDGRKATGGPIQAGQPYLVGEEGPELIFPEKPGWVANNSLTKQIFSAPLAGFLDSGVSGFFHALDIPFFNLVNPFQGPPSGRKNGLRVPLGGLDLPGGSLSAGIFGALLKQITGSRGDSQAKPGGIGAIHFSPHITVTGGADGRQVEKSVYRATEQGFDYFRQRIEALWNDEQRVDYGC